MVEFDFTFTGIDLFLNDDVWISYFLYFLKKIKIYSLQQHIKKRNDGKPSLIYTKRTITTGLVDTYGKTNAMLSYLFTGLYLLLMIVHVFTVYGVVWTVLSLTIIH